MYVNDLNERGEGVREKALAHFPRAGLRAHVTHFFFQSRRNPGSAFEALRVS